ncbi:uncharacterized protein PAE49_023281 isoform 2-T2 [Odontesthes bonariensis]|uniref:uncharacterized protein LOC142370750 isoform X2 n=1 Tax=Odontesthes bonariensis TaxID=219752 RepID=UPI003F585139
MGSCTATRTPLLCSSNSRVRLHGHCGNMTLCGYKSLLFLFVVLTTIDLSKEGCRDYFQMEHWTKMFKKAKTPNITLYSTKDFKNISECTLSNFCQGKECKDTNMLCCILSDCLPVQGDFSECEKESLGNVSLFNFRCLMAKHKKLEADGCEGFETVCKHYANILLSGSNQAPLPTTQHKPTASPQTTTTTTLSQKTTLEPTTTTKVTVDVSSTANVIQCICGRTTSAPTTSEFLSSTETTLRPNNNKQTTAKVTPNHISTEIGDNLFSKSEEMKSNTLMALLVFSASLNFMLPLAFCLYMHQQRRQDRRQQHSESISLNPDGSATR